MKQKKKYKEYFIGEDYHCEEMFFISGFEKFDVDEFLITSLFEKTKYHENATYGDMKTHETKTNDHVRRGKDISADEFKIPQPIIRNLEDEWEYNMGDKVRIEYYKINLYEKGDFFVKHKDSPSKNLIGTLLYSLQQDENENRKLNNVFYVHDSTGKIHCWNEHYPFIGFYGNLIHEVKPVVTNRVTIAFKVYSDNEDNKTKPELQLNNLLQDQITKCNGRIGFILNHEYSLESEDLKGIDKIIYEACINNPLYNTKIISIVDKMEIMYDDNTDVWDYCNYSKVYYLNKSSLGDSITCENQKLNIPELPHNEQLKQEYDKLSHIVFFEGNEFDTKTINNHNRNPIDYVGNEAQMGEINNIYLKRAIVFTKK